MATCVIATPTNCIRRSHRRHHSYSSFSSSGNGISSVIQQAADRINLSPQILNRLANRLQEEYIIEPWQLASISDEQWQSMSAPIGFVTSLQTCLATKDDDKIDKPTSSVNHQASPTPKVDQSPKKPTRGREKPSSSSKIQISAETGRLCYKSKGQVIYEWEQTFNNIILYVPKPSNIHHYDIECIIDQDRVRIGSRETSEYFFNRPTGGTVNCSKSSWVPYGGTDVKGIIVTLTKTSPGIKWRRPLKCNISEKKAAVAASSLDSYKDSEYPYSSPRSRSKAMAKIAHQKKAKDPRAMDFICDSSTKRKGDQTRLRNRRRRDVSKSPDKPRPVQISQNEYESPSMVRKAPKGVNSAFWNGSVKRSSVQSLSSSLHTSGTRNSNRSTRSDPTSTAIRKLQARRDPFFSPSENKPRSKSILKKIVGDDESSFASSIENSESELTESTQPITPSSSGIQPITPSQSDTPPITPAKRPSITNFFPDLPFSPPERCVIPRASRRSSLPPSSPISPLSNTGVEDKQVGGDGFNVLVRPSAKSMNDFNMVMNHYSKPRDQLDTSLRSFATTFNNFSFHGRQ